MHNAIRDEAQAFLDVWFETRRVVQTLNFNRFHCRAERTLPLLSPIKMRLCAKGGLPQDSAIPQCMMSQASALEVWKKVDTAATLETLACVASGGNLRLRLVSACARSKADAILQLQFVHKRSISGV